MSKLIFELSKTGRRCAHIPKWDGPTYDIEQKLTRSEAPALPETAEVDLVRHFTNLSKMAYGVDNGFYPLGSCTMKYNPASGSGVYMPGFTDIHPLQPEEDAQGCLEAISLLEASLSEITGMNSFSLNPAAGAHGEFTGLMMVKAYFEKKGETNRKRVIVPDSAHGTNPASAAMCGFCVITAPSGPDGNVDIERLKPLLNEETAALMLTNPNTLGLFEKDILKIAEAVHEAGGLLYYDGANMNAIMGIARPGDMGFDIVHLNLHKTFGTPHGGGGPGSGPVGCKAFLKDFLPNPAVTKPASGADGFSIYNSADSVGKVGGFYGNFMVYLRALSYILTLGAEGLKEASENAVLNANYLMHMLRGSFDIPFDRPCMHEFVISLSNIKKETSVSALDFAKALIDYGIHPPTMYFPLIVPEAFMIEPTETESPETLDGFAEIMKVLLEKTKTEPEALKNAPQKAPVGRLDEVKAARSPVLIYGGNL